MAGKPVEGKASGWTRRRLLAAGVAAGASLVPLLGRAALTPSQAEGPFYPSAEPADSDADLTRVEGRSGIAEGRPGHHRTRWGLPVSDHRARGLRGEPELAAAAAHPFQSPRRRL